MARQNQQQHLQRQQQSAFPRPSTSLASLSYALDVLKHDQQQQQPNSSDTDTDVIDNRHKNIGGAGGGGGTNNNFDFVDYEELRRRQLLGRIDDVGTGFAAAYNSSGRPGIETAPSDEHLGDPQLPPRSTGRRDQKQEGHVASAARNQLPPRYAPKRSPRGVADAHRQSPSQLNAKTKSTPLDSTEADFDALKSRTLLQAFDRMKRDERLATIGHDGGDASGAAMEEDHAPDGRLHRRPDPEGEISTPEEGRSHPRHRQNNNTEEESYDNDASSSSQRVPRGSNNADPGNDRNRQADATVRSIERTLAEIRTKRKTRKQIDDGEIQTVVKEEVATRTAKTTSITTTMAVTGGTSPSGTATNTASVSDKNVANRPRRREKEPSPSPSGRYGAASPVPPDDGLDLDHQDRDVSSSNGTAIPNSAGGDFISNQTRGNAQDGGNSTGLREKPIDRMLAKHAVINSVSSPPFAAKISARSTGRSVRFDDDDDLEHQSVVSTLPSLGTDGYTEDDTTMDDDHYFRQDAALNPPTTPVRAAMKSLSPSERLAFQQKAEEVQMAQRVGSSDGDEKQNIGNASSGMRGGNGDEFWASTKSDAYVLAGAWSPSAHPMPSPVGTRREGVGNVDTNSSQRTPRSLSPLSEFLQVKKQLASMPKSSTQNFSGEISGSTEPIYRNRRAESQNYQINIGIVKDNERTMDAKKNVEGSPPPKLNVSEEEAAMDEYVKQLRARLPQAKKSDDIASATLTPKRDMRKKSNRLRDIRPPAASATPVGANIMVGATNGVEDTSLLSEGISTMEKQIAEITSRERSATHPSHSSSSSSSESSSSEFSSSQIAECVRDISPPPTPIRDVRKRERLERTRGKVSSGTATKRETDRALQRKKYEEDTIFDSLPSAVNNQRDTDGSVATEDDNGLLHFMVTSSVPSTLPYASSRDDDQPMKDDFVKPVEPRAKATLNGGRPEDFSGNYRQSDQSISSDSSSTSQSQSTTGSQSMSNEGFNHDINNRHGASTKPASIRMKDSQERLSSGDRSSREQWVHKRTKSGHSSFSRGDFSTPSDEHREYRRDEIGFSGAVSDDNTTRRSPLQVDVRKRAVSGNDNLDSLNSIAAKHVERGEYTLALQAFNKILESQEARYGEVHPFVASTYHNLGIVHSKNAKSQTDPRDIEKSNSEALLCFQNAARVARDALGSDHPNVAVSLVRLGFILLSMKQFENALVTFEEALRVRIASLGSDHALVSKIQNNIGVTCFQMKRFADAGEAFHSALEIQRKVLSRLLFDCKKGNIREDFLQRAKLELADTLCNIASLNLTWAETEQMTKTKELSLLDESILTFEEALQIRLEEVGESHPTAQRTEVMLEKARGAHAAAKKRPENKMPKTTKKSKRSLNPLGLSEDIRSKSLATVRISNNDDENSLAENSVLTSQVLCSPGQMDVCGFGAGLGGLYRYAASGNETPSGFPSTKRNSAINEGNCCPVEEDKTVVWVAPHCILPPDERRKTDPLFSDDAQFKSILGWPEERKKTLEDLFTSEGITIPGTESVGSSITMEKVNMKAGGDNADEESVMITNLALPFDDGEEGQLPVPSSSGVPASSKNESKKRKSRRGLMLIRPSISRRKSPKQRGEETFRKTKANAGAPASSPAPASSAKRKSILRRKAKNIKSSPTNINNVRDIDGGGSGGGDGPCASWKDPPKKEVDKMLKNPDQNIEKLYTIGASHLKRAEYAEAESMFRTLLAHHRKKHGEVHPYVGSAMHNLGIVLLRAERNEDALVAFEDAARVRKEISSRNGGLISPDVATTLVKVGITNLLLKRFERALESFTEALSIRRRALGELDPQVGRVYNNIGCVNCELNHLNEACGSFEASLEVQRHALRLDADNASLKFGMSTTLCNLGYLYHREGRHLKSVAALKEALQLQEASLGKHHPTVLTTLDSLADAHARINDHKEAIRLYSDCLTRHNVSVEESNGQMNSDERHASAIILFKISRVYLKKREFDASYRKLKEAKFYAQGLEDGTVEKIEAEIQKMERSRR